MRLPPIAHAGALYADGVALVAHGAAAADHWWCGTGSAPTGSDSARQPIPRRFGAGYMMLIGTHAEYDRIDADPVEQS